MAVESNQKVVLTPAAEESLNKLSSRYRELLIARAKRARYIPGEDFIEITASDIIRAHNRPHSGRSIYNELLPIITIFASAAMFLYGVFYESIRMLIFQDPARLLYTLLGIIGFVLGLFQMLLSRQHMEYRIRKEVEREAEERNSLSSQIATSSGEPPRLP